MKSASPEPHASLAGSGTKKGMVAHPFSVCHPARAYFVVVVMVLLVEGMVVGAVIVVLDVMVVFGVMVVVMVMVEEVAATAKLATLQVRATAVRTMRLFFMLFSFSL